MTYSKLLFFFLKTLFSGIFICLTHHTQAQINPLEEYPELFREVQLKAVYPDSKTFADAIPKVASEEVVEMYDREKQKAGFDLKQFVEKYFIIPSTKDATYQTPEGISLEAHIDTLWQVLSRPPDTIYSSLIALPKPYIVPGGRFREIYYWDSYFTMLGLQVAGKTQVIENMVDNFAHLIDKIGFIPNGNRTYYNSRSQPPFFSLMVMLLSEQKGEKTIQKYLPQLQKEYDFWMKNKENLNAQNPAQARVVRLEDGTVLNRYWDDQAAPRPESYKEDVELSEKSKQSEEDLYRNLRAACESGWDFSTRWFADGKDLGSIQTTEILPVDLNTLLYHLEKILAQAYKLEGNTADANRYEKLTEQRAEAIRKYFWGGDFYMDYHWKSQKTSPHYTLAGAYPLFFEMASKKEAKLVSKKLAQDFLKVGGLITTLVESGQQWDSPNGWAPLQWIAIKGLRNYKLTKTSQKIKDAWVASNRKVFDQTGKLVEKYNMLSTKDEAGGGEYPLQDGFGWSNGVLLKLISEK